MRAFLNKPIIAHFLVAFLTVMVIVMNSRLGLGLDSSGIAGVVALGVAVILGVSARDAATIVGDAHIDAMHGAEHIAQGNNPDGSPKS